MNAVSESDDVGYGASWNKSHKGNDEKQKCCRPSKRKMIQLTLLDLQIY